ncbi:MAG: PorV/PorQ family protein [Candidatus Firestonebacteria bacterium]
MKKSLILIVFVVFNCNFVFAGAGATSGGVLLEPLGARSVGLGGACSSLTEDVTFLHYNPASLVGLKVSEISVLYYNSGTTGMNYGSITYGQPIGFGNAGISVAYLNGGEMELNFIDGSTTNVISEQDVRGTISIGIPFGEKLGLGASAKVLYSSLVNSRSASGIAADVGAIYKGLILDEVNVGASVVNIGTGLKYLDTVESLPINIQGGVSYNFNIIEDIKLLVAVDGVYSLNDKVLMIRSGIEGNYGDISVRIGVPFSSVDDQSWTVGVGYRLNEFGFDYGASFGKVLGLTHRISIGMKLGEEEIGKHRKK